jgi:hypothetical protein
MQPSRNKGRPQDDSNHHAKRRPVVTTSRTNLAYFKPETGVPQSEEPSPEDRMIWTDLSRSGKRFLGKRLQPKSHDDRVRLARFRPALKLDLAALTVPNASLQLTGPANLTRLQRRILWIQERLQPEGEELQKWFTTAWPQS